MSVIHLFGIDHTRVPLDIGEQGAFDRADLLRLLPALRGGVIADGELKWLPTEPLCRQGPLACILNDADKAFHLAGNAAVQHMLAVAASLLSQVPGDTHIAGQVAAAAEAAREAGTLGPILERLAKAALRAAKRVRRETGLMADGMGMGPSMLNSLRRCLPHPGRCARRKRLIVLGTGQVASEAVKHLLLAPDFVIAGIWARDRRRAVRFAARFDLPVLTEREAHRALSTVDGVIGACRGRVPLLDAATLRPILDKRVEPLLVLDLGVPGNLDPVCAGSDGLQAIFLDQLQRHMRDRLQVTAGDVAGAEQIIAAEAERFGAWERQLPLQPIRAEVYASLEGVLGKWRDMQPAAVRHLRIALHRTLEQAFAQLNP
ncbi:MAG: hypothetical protein HYX27_21385 [Acidobacteria bacterium]|nr:hypothetical protein [Acidobacteriota bacterium]